VVARWVDDGTVDAAGARVRGGESAGGAADEEAGAAAEPALLGRPARVGDGGGGGLHADDVGAAERRGERDSAHARVEIDHVPAGRGAGDGRGLGVEPGRRRTVDLEEGARREAEAHVADLLGERVDAVEDEAGGAPG